MAIHESIINHLTIFKKFFLSNNVHENSSISATSLTVYRVSVYCRQAFRDIAHLQRGAFLMCSLYVDALLRDNRCIITCSIIQVN